MGVAIAAKKLLEGKGKRVRVVSAPCWDAFERLPPEPLVGVGVPSRHAALVGPVHVDRPPVDAGGAVCGQALVAPAGRLAAGESEREQVAGSGPERLDDTLAELAGYVVDDE